MSIFIDWLRQDGLDGLGMKSLNFSLQMKVFDDNVFIVRIALACLSGFSMVPLKI